LVVEVVDESSKIDAFFEAINPYLKRVRYGCLVIIEEAKVLMYKPKKKKTIFEF
jgi:PII-like signaling protein